MPTAVARAIEGCLEPDPASRPQVKELSRELDRFVESRLGQIDER